VLRWQENALAVGWEEVEPAQVEEEHDLAEQTHWDICCLKAAHYYAQVQEQRVCPTVLVQPQFLDPVP
jgi:hypothetical protein